MEHIARGDLTGISPNLSTQRPSAGTNCATPHFGVKFSTSFKLTVLTTVNIDGENSVPIKCLADGDGASTTSCVPPPVFSAKAN